MAANIKHRMVNVTRFLPAMSLLLWIGSGCAPVQLKSLAPSEVMKTMEGQYVRAVEAKKLPAMRELLGMMHKTAAFRTVLDYAQPHLSHAERYVIIMEASVNRGFDPKQGFDEPLTEKN